VGTTIVQHFMRFKKKEKIINTQDILLDKIYYFQAPLARILRFVTGI
jgi:hypothetical protein